MKISGILKNKTPVFSFEFFPPKTTKGEEALYRAIDELRELAPDFVSVTYGAGGSTRSKTLEWVTTIKREHGVEAMAHLTCVGASRDEIGQVLGELVDRGIENVLALRGDPPKGAVHFETPPDGFSHANELVEYIRKNRLDLSVGVAGYPEKHPECVDKETDLVNLRRKIAAGADFVITQLFFDTSCYFDLVQRLGVDVAVIPGIMPITSNDQIDKFILMCGASIPPPLKAAVLAAGSDEEVTDIGIAFAIEQVKALLAGGAPGIHFYTLNKSSATKRILTAIREQY